MTALEIAKNTFNRMTTPIVPATAAIKLPETICPQCSGAGRNMVRPGAPICETCHGFGAIPSLPKEASFSE